MNPEHPSATRFRLGWTSEVVKVGHLTARKGGPEGGVTAGVLFLQQASAEGASVPTCPSPTVNQYRLDEDEEQLVDADVQDLLISVDEPESHVTTIETFITYRVVTKVMACGTCLVLGSSQASGWLPVLADHTQRL